jgi:protein arginine kinase
VTDFKAVHEYPAWYREPGPEGDVVVSSRVRLSRNLSSVVFPHLLREDGLERVRRLVEDALRGSGAAENPVRYDGESLAADEAALLGEEGLLEPDEGVRGVSLFPVSRPDLWAAVNVKDHLRIFALRGGLDLRRAWTAADELDSRLETLLDYAVSPEWGYLSAEIGNLGPALRASTLLHLPAVVLGGRSDKIEEIVEASGHRIRPFLPGEEAPGDMFLLSGSPEIGVSEAEMLEKLEEISRSLLNYEREMRSLLFEKKKDFLEDQVCRAVGILERAKFLRCEEAVKLLSLVRMGCAMDCAAHVDRNAVTALLFQSRPAHVRMRMEEGSGDEERENGERAAWIRAGLENSSR